jgi:prepilin peptidase CpaA
MFDTATALSLSVFPGMMIAAALSDLSTMTIPNRISAVLVLAFFPTALLVGLPPMQAAAHVGVGFAALLIGAGMFALRWIGGGDAKVFAAAGLWLGLDGAPSFLMWTAVAGGLFAVALLSARDWAQPYAVRAPQWVGRLLTPDGDIPYGVAIAAGALAAFPESVLMRGFTGVF